MYAIRCLSNGWTSWMNSYYPTLTNNGDFETEPNLRQEYVYCAQHAIRYIECRVVNIGTPSWNSGQVSNTIPKLIKHYNM